MKDFSELDGWFSVVLGAFLAMVAGMGSFFGLKHRVTTAERDIVDIKDNHRRHLTAIETQIQTVRHEVRADIHEVGERAEKRHDELSTLMRTLISKTDNT